ncbi:MAG: hypothetical protein IKI58_00720 [Oscillospiraceae bacterium]|nr:hypothetical protein [Oscillospiraceae bacterium]
MTLLLTCLAAVTVTVIWYVSPRARKLKIGSLALMYWGASLMWLVDAVTEYIELRADYFRPEAADLLNDTLLGFAVAVLGAVIWLVALLIRDPEGVVRASLFRKN